MEKTVPHGTGAVKWVSTDWLEDRLRDPNLMLLDTQPNVHDYIQEHIPGAFYFNQGLLRVHRGRLPAEFVPEETFKTLARTVGLRADVPVVVYTGVGAFKGWGDGLEQTMVAYCLARFGHDHVYVLDGGLDKWKQERRPLTQEYGRVEESNFRARVRDELFVDYEQIKDMKDREDVLLIDARPNEVYQGQGPWAKPGHIPGAINIPWPSLMHPDNTRLLKPDDQIQAILDRNGVSRDQTIVWYCGTGREATNPFILFKWYLDFPKVKLYEGSFTEWSAYPDNPVVTGPEPY